MAFWTKQDIYVTRKEKREMFTWIELAVKLNLTTDNNRGVYVELVLAGGELLQFTNGKVRLHV